MRLGSSILPPATQLKEKSMIKVIANSNPREAVNEANQRGLKKEDIVAVLKDPDSGQLLIIYEEDYGRGNN